jgi:hypothetical protein
MFENNLSLIVNTVWRRFPWVMKDELYPDTSVSGNAQNDLLG